MSSSGLPQKVNIDKSGSNTAALERINSLLFLLRQLMGYSRFDNEGLVELMNDLYKNEVSQMNNFFLPNFKLIKKQRVQSKIIRKHSKPETPYQRLIKSEHISEDKKKELTDVYNQLNPFTLQKIIQKKLKRIFAMVNVKTDSKMRYI
jgi:hypothetical protein